MTGATTTAHAANPSNPGVDRRALAAAGITIVFWASAFVGIRDVADTFSPVSIALGRMVVAAVALGAVLLTQGWTPVRRRDLGLIIVSGLLWDGVYMVAPP